MVSNMIKTMMGMADGKMARRAMKKRSALLSGNKFIST